MLGSESYSITEWLSQLDEPHLADEAWANLLERLYPVSMERARRYHLSPGEADSIHSRSVLKMFTRLKSGAVTVTNRGQLFGLLSKIARDEAVDRLKARQRMPSLPNLLADGDDTAVDDTLPRWVQGAPSLEEEEETNLLERRLLAALNDEQLAVYQLRVEEELEVEQIKDRLGKSKESVYRRLQEIDDVIRAIRTDGQLTWLRDENDRSVRERVERLLDETTGKVYRLWLERQAPEAIAEALKTTPTRAYKLLAELDNIVYVVRYEAAIDALRQQIKRADGVALGEDIRGIVKKRKWPLYERWLAGGDTAELLADGTFERGALFEGLRSFHESARAIRRVL